MNTALLVMLSNYAHDLATGLLFGSVLAHGIARRVLRGAGETAQLAALRRDLFRRFRPVVLGSLAAVLLLGVPRMVFYRQYEWLPAAGRDQVPALVAKHVILVAVTAWSLAAFFRCPRRRGGRDA